MTLTSSSHKMMRNTLHIIWPMYLQNFKLLRLTVEKKMHVQENTLFDLWPWTWIQVPSTLNIMWPIHMQSLKVLCRRVKEEMHLQEDAIYDLWPWSKGQGHRKYCPVPSTLCDLCTCKVWSKYIKWLRRCIYKKIHYLTLTPTPRSRSHKIMLSSLLHDVSYVPAKFEVATFNGLGGDAFTRNLTEGRTDGQTSMDIYCLWTGRIYGQDIFAFKDSWILSIANNLSISYVNLVLIPTCIAHINMTLIFQRLQ